VATNDDTRYFEFGRSRRGDPDFYLRERVFKCTYVDRATVICAHPKATPVVSTSAL
jgi:hypothetical protein